MNHFEHNAISCRICHYRLDAATNAHLDGDDQPTTGSFSVCMNCGEVSIYEVATDGTVSLREANFVELEIFNRQFGNAARIINEAIAKRDHHRYG